MISWCDLPFTLALASAEEAAGRVAEGVRGGRAEFDTNAPDPLSLAAIVLVLCSRRTVPAGDAGPRRTTVRRPSDHCRAHRLGCARPAPLAAGPMVRTRPGPPRLEPEWFYPRRSAGV